MKEKIVTIGNSLDALQHANQSNSYLILNKMCFPQDFEPPYIKNAWGLLYTHLMLKGRVVGGDAVVAINLKEDNIVVICARNITNTIEYDEVHIFNDENIAGLPEIEEEVDRYRVVDCMKAIYLRIKNKQPIYTKDSLVSELHIVKEYITAPTRLYSVSSLTKKDLTDFNYSDTMVKFKCENLLAQHGHRGDRTALIQLAVTARSTQKAMNKYKETEKIKFLYAE